MPCWEWVGDGSIQRSWAEKHSAATGSGEARAYGTTYRYNNVRPKKSATFNGRGFTWSEVSAYITTAEKPTDWASSSVTITDFGARTWTGKISNLSWKRAEEGTDLWDMTLTIDYPT